MAAWTKWPTRDSRKCTAVTDFSLDAALTMVRNLVSLSCSRETAIEAESNWMPRKVMDVMGPSVFSGAMGTLSSWDVWSVTASTSLHSGEEGGPSRRKSSF